jgi:hypothetical protein
MKSISIPRGALAALAAATLALAVASCGGGGGGGAGAVATPAPAPEQAVIGPAWPSFGRDAQHSAVTAVQTQPLSRILWSTPVDLAPQYTTDGSLLTHYGSPVITDRGVLVLPVKTGANGPFRIEGRNAATGDLLWSQASSWQVPPHDWTPSYNVTLTPSGKVVAPSSGGRILVRDSAAAGAATTQIAFYGNDAYAANAATYDANVFICTPITVDAQGAMYFGFMVTGATPANLTGGIARIAPDGTGRWVAATAATGDPAATKAVYNSAPALSPDGRTVYAAVNSPLVANTIEAGWLVALDSATLGTKAKVALMDPLSGLRANVLDDGTASPTVAANGDVFFGVLESFFGEHDARGWMLHFNSALGGSFAPGSFGWDVTASLVPAAMVPSYTGPSTQLLAVKYNDYEGAGTGTGQNRLAVLDPGSTQVDTISGNTVMREVLTILGPTLEGTAGARKEWCINTMAVDPATNSVIANSEDGVLYRWSLASNSFPEKIRLTAGLGEAYTPTAVGPDGIVYAVSNATLFAVGR